jgi:hypothetical protein
MECTGLSESRIPESLGHAHEDVSMAPKSLAQHHLRFISWSRGGDQRVSDNPRGWPSYRSRERTRTTPCTRLLAKSIVRHETARPSAGFEDVVRRTFAQESSTGSTKLHCLALEGEAGLRTGLFAVLDGLGCNDSLAFGAELDPSLDGLLSLRGDGHVHVRFLGLAAFIPLPLVRRSL